ncbi:MAG TPA: hypothetical protein VIU85_00380 [Chthoniobacterales bacterium]
MQARIVLFVEVTILTALILATRCANYQDVFVGGRIYFVDADCYARMSRVRMCAEHPGLIIRHHDFENFPEGTTPHTTAPLDYLLVTLSILLRPFATQPIDLAGALISPILALVGGWVLSWWSRRLKFVYRWSLLILYALSPILVHGTELGRPDHQSLLILFVAIGVCAEWILQSEPSRNWSVVSGFAWALALWVSFYEPLILLGLIVVTSLTKDRQRLVGLHRRTGWIVFAVIIVFAFLIERRIPSLSIFQSGAAFQNWARSIGELAHVSPLNRIWFVWAGYMIVLAPILIWISIRKRTAPPFSLLVLLVATFGLTIWQARWSYFFVLIFAIALPSLLVSVKSRVAVWLALTLSILPVLDFWDAQVWPNETELARRVERRNESVQMRDLAATIRSDQTRAFLAPWWWSPAISYWSGQPGIAGSSHESLSGIAESALFYLSEDPRAAREILRNRRVEWVFAYDWEQVGQNSANLLGTPLPERNIGRVLDRTPGQAPAFLVLSGQNGTAKLFRFVDKL